MKYDPNPITTRPFISRWTCLKDEYYLARWEATSPETPSINCMRVWGSAMWPFNFSYSKVMCTTLPFSIGVACNVRYTLLKSFKRSPSTTLNVTKFLLISMAWITAFANWFFPSASNYRIQIIQSHVQIGKRILLLMILCGQNERETDTMCT